MPKVETKKESMEGIVKWASKEKGYGFIAAEGNGVEIHMYLSHYRGEGVLNTGDKVRFDLRTERPGKPSATNIDLIERCATANGRGPYYGKPSKLKDSIGAKTARSFAGLAMGAGFGPIGLVLGAALGFGAGGGQVISTCLKCGGSGHVTAVDEAHIGFQCEKCGGFWRKPNKDKIRLSDLER